MNNTTYITFNNSLDSPLGVFPDIELIDNATFRFCGFPGFCSVSDFELCAFTPLISCHICGVARASVFMFVVMCVSLGIVIGNTLIILVGIKRYKEGKLRKMDICRTSLAIADISTGIHLLVAVPFAFSWSVYLTPEELSEQVLEVRGSIEAYIGGIVFLFSFMSSIYHLLYLAALRGIALCRPLTYKQISNTRVTWNIGCVWLFSLLASSFPAWIPSQFTFSYHVSTFLYNPTIESVSEDTDYTASIAVVTIFSLLPYFLLILSIVGSGVLIKRIEVQRKQILSESKAKNDLSRVIAAYKTVAIMTLGFTITLIPLSIVVCLFYAGYFDCSTSPTPRLICTYLGMLNSFINAWIYSFRDKSFRQYAKKVILSFGICKTCCNCSISIPNMRSTNVSSSRSASLHSSKEPYTTTSEIGLSNSKIKSLQDEDSI